jgi:hypothetical protein
LIYFQEESTQVLSDILDSNATSAMEEGLQPLGPGALEDGQYGSSDEALEDGQYGASDEALEDGQYGASDEALEPQATNHQQGGEGEGESFAPDGLSMTEECSAAAAGDGLEVDCDNGLPGHFPRHGQPPENGVAGHGAEEEAQQDEGEAAVAYDYEERLQHQDHGDDAVLSGDEEQLQQHAPSAAAAACTLSSC